MRRICIGVKGRLCGRLTAGTRCDGCAAIHAEMAQGYSASRGGTTTRGYGSKHQGAVRQLRARVARTGEPCWLCGEPFGSLADVTADHILPLAHGGTDDPSNYAPAHAACNARRGGQTRAGS